jgi:uncharacterized protein YukE
MGNQIRAEFGTLDQLAADQASHSGAIQEYKDLLRQQALAAIGDLAGGAGSDQHERCMRIVDDLINEHIDATNSFQRTTGNVNETFQAGGHRVRSIFSTGA